MNAIASEKSLPVVEKSSCQVTAGCETNLDAAQRRETCPENAEIKIGWGGRRPGAGRKPASKPVAIPRLGLRWYVVETHPQAERPAVHEITRQGWRTYLPLIATRQRDRVTPTMFHKITVPMFRGYLFVEFDRHEPTWGCILSARGVRGIIKSSTGQPMPTPSDFVESMMAGDADRLELKSVANVPRIKGERLMLTVGALASFPGTVVECDGITTTLNVELFGRLVKVDAPWQTLAATVVA